jgi:RNA polymerase sigma-70 factor, ECF subfamily
MTDEQLLASIARGDANALSTLFERHQTRLYSFILRTVNDDMLADDIFQEAILRIARGASNFEARTAKASTWMYRIAFNACIDALRRARRTLPLDVLGNALASEDDPGMNGADPIELGALRRALDALSPEHRAVVRLSYFEQLGHQDIAEITGVPVGTVKSRLHHALKKLSAALRRTHICI